MVIEEMDRMPKTIPQKGVETILLVEDEEIVRRLTHEILEMNGYKVLEATCGKVALLLCEEIREPIHLMITDVLMPEMSGQELAEKISKLHPEISILFMSGYMDDVIIRHRVMLEETNFLQKPFSADSLLRKIRVVLDAKA